MGKSKKKNNWKEFDKQNLGFVSNLEKNEDGQIVVQKALKKLCSGPSRGQRQQRAPFEALGAFRSRGSDENASNGGGSGFSGGQQIVSLAAADLSDAQSSDHRVDDRVGPIIDRDVLVNGGVDGREDPVSSRAVGRVKVHVGGRVNGRVVDRVDDRVDLDSLHSVGRIDGCVPEASFRPVALPRGPHLDSQSDATVALARLPDASNCGPRFQHGPRFPVDSSKPDMAVGVLLRGQLSGASAFASATCIDSNVSKKRVADSLHNIDDYENLSDCKSDVGSDPDFTPSVLAESVSTSLADSENEHDDDALSHGEQQNLDNDQEPSGFGHLQNSVHQCTTSAVPVQNSGFFPGKGKPMENIGEKKLGEVTMAKSWKSLFSENRKVNSGLSLEKYTSSLNYVELKEDDFENDENYEWRHCLVGYFAGKFPGFNALKNLVACTWKVNVSIHRHDSGWIIFKFNCKGDMDGVIQNGPYAIFGRSLILKIMPKFFSFDSKELSCFPVWLQVKNVPLYAWSPIPLGKILSFIGKPLCTDKVTATRERVSFVRALVEVDLAHELPSKVDVKLPDNGMCSFPVVYESLPLFCNHCKRMGHVISNCAMAPKHDVEGHKKGQENGDEVTIGNVSIGQMHGKNSGNVLVAAASMKNDEPDGARARNSEEQGLDLEQKNSVSLRTQHDENLGSSSEVQGLSANRKPAGLGAVLRGGLSGDALGLSSDVQGLSVKEKHAESTETTADYGFELKRRVDTSPNGVGTQSTLMQRFINIIECANSMSLMENWVNYMEECMVPLGTG